MSYGSHPNDFLLIECLFLTGGVPQNLNDQLLTQPIDGFCLDDNESDAIFLDDVIFRELSKSEKDELNMQQYLGYDYVVLHNYYICSFLPGEENTLTDKGNAVFNFLILVLVLVTINSLRMASAHERKWLRV
jgi:hypothetical protein